MKNIVIKNNLNVTAPYIVMVKNKNGWVHVIKRDGWDDVYSFCSYIGAKRFLDRIKSGNFNSKN